MTKENSVMDEKEKRKLLVATGKELLQKELVARTWGNISCRLDSRHCLITPSGLDYMQTQEDDIVMLDIRTEEWEGEHKPSGERGVHIAAYRCFPDTEFVIHTHQKYATAIGLTGLEDLDITDAERERLGGIGIASYGLPGMKKLTDAVTDVLKQGIQTVFMIHHGVLICGSNRDEAMERAQLLEDICRRNIRGLDVKAQSAGGCEALQTDQASRYAEIFHTAAVDSCADRGNAVYAQVDDMAQMIGRKIPCAADEREAAAMLRKYPAVLIKGSGAAVRAETADDLEALKLLVDKSCLCAVHTQASGRISRIGAVDVALMNFVYKHKYSKQKDRERS